MTEHDDLLTEKIREADRCHGRTPQPTETFAQEVTRMEEAIRGWQRGVWSDSGFSEAKRRFVLSAFDWTLTDAEDHDAVKRESAIAWLHRGEAARQQGWRIEVAMARMDEVEEGPLLLGGDTLDLVRRHWLRWASDDTAVQREEDKLLYPFDLPPL